MTKADFIDELCKKMRSFPPEEAEKAANFYAEAIDDRIEDGMDEAAAIAELGSIDDIVSELAASLPLTAIVKQRAEDVRNKAKGGAAAWLAVLGSPLWIPLLIAAAAVVLAVFVSLWAVALSIVISIIAVAVSGAAAVLGGIVLPYTTAAPRLMLAGAGLFVVGLGIVLWPLGKGLCVGLARGVRALVRLVKTRLVRNGGREA